MGFDDTLDVTDFPLSRMRPPTSRLLSFTCFPNFPPLSTMLLRPAFVCSSPCLRESTARPPNLLLWPPILFTPDFACLSPGFRELTTRSPNLPPCSPTFLTPDVVCSIPGTSLGIGHRI